MSGGKDGDLEALLHRCHRDELLALAEIVQVDARNLGLRDLARETALAARKAGSHEFADGAFRGGRPRRWAEIVADLAKQKGWTAASLEVTESALLREQFAKRWEGLDEAARTALWAKLGAGAPAPATSGDAVSQLADRFGRGVGYAFGVGESLVQGNVPAVGGLVFGTPFGCLLRPFFPLVAPAYVAWKLRARPDLVQDAAVEVARLRQIVAHRVTIGVVGSPSTGKDAAIKALFGVDTGNISPVAGSTKEVAIQRVPGATAMYLVNTPGMGDVVERVTEEARQVLDHIDLYLYLVNAEGGVQAREQADHARCRATGKPVLAIVNKVDVLRPRDKDKFLADTKEKLGAPDEDFVAVAFDPLPALAPAPINREAVRAWLVAHLIELGKDPTELPPLPVVAPPT